MINDIAKSDKALRTIGEVAQELDIATHVLRFWESKFSQINPKKRRGRRYYRVEDIAVITQIQDLLYNQGYTIRGVQKFLANNNTSINEVNNDHSSPIHKTEDNSSYEPTISNLDNQTNSPNAIAQANRSSVFNLSKRQRLALEKVLYQLIKARNILQDISFSN